MANKDDSVTISSDTEPSLEYMLTQITACIDAIRAILTYSSYDAGNWGNPTKEEILKKFEEDLS